MFAPGRVWLNETLWFRSVNRSILRLFLGTQTVAGCAIAGFSVAVPIRYDDWFWVVFGVSPLFRRLIRSWEPAWVTVLGAFRAKVDAGMRLGSPRLQEDVTSVMSMATNNGSGTI
jgi:hypothetical protein